MKNNEEYLKVIEELKNSIDVLMQGFYDLKSEIKEFRKKKKIDLKRQFSVINLPSKGIYYPDKNKSLLIKYLTAAEEHVLCDSFLMETGRGIKIVLENIIIDDIDVDNLLLSDFQAILIFLRSTSYGDSVEFTPTCPHCGREQEQNIRLSEIEFKKPNSQPLESGKYVVYLPELELEFTISPMTIAKALTKIENETDDDFFNVKDEDGITVKIKKEKSLNLVYNIDSINGISNKDEIKKIIRKLPKRFVDAIVEFIETNDVGINENINMSCSFCQEDFVQRINVGYNFISLPANYKETIYEEVFLLNYYGKSVTREDAMSMPVVERKWAIRRIKEEMDKKAEAEKKAISKSKSSKGR